MLGNMLPINQTSMSSSLMVTGYPDCNELHTLMVTQYGKKNCLKEKKKCIPNKYDISVYIYRYMIRVEWHFYP